MKLASWIVAAHFRPRLLRATLSVLRDAVWPSGWRHEIIVAYHEGDPDSGIVAHELGAAAIPTHQPNPGGKRNVALAASQGELILVTDDDDFQSSLRATHAAAAYEAGHVLSGIREFRRLHLPSGQVVRWSGSGHDGLPPVFCGTARNYSRKLLDRMGGWNPRLASLEDSELHRRITSRRRINPGVKEKDLGAVLAESTIILQHGGNIFDRPEIGAGAETMCGAYKIRGEGHWSTVANFPAAVAERLRGNLL